MCLREYGQSGAHLLYAHPVEDALPRLGDDMPDHLAQVSLDEHPVASQPYCARFCAPTDALWPLLVQQCIEEVQQVDASVEIGVSDLVDVAVPDVVGALGGVFERERGDLGDGQDRRREFRDERDELHPDLLRMCERRSAVLSDARESCAHLERVHGGQAAVKQWTDNGQPWERGNFTRSTLKRSPCCSECDANSCVCASRV